ncbi:ASCH domain-containing protein [Salinibacterium sp. NK8237]|uniref:ASCH domain-containing protein n=1 Tax=Salinibacterium sp. NK8237 TaxID=2792038 RepID=UPI0018CF6125|nr:ASCH domain-containing protein [Salinibacterium sp. NK8237]MBH0128825.1 ASCH domain-containing protein [Salinibacterium sp. NK8237]
MGEIDDLPVSEFAFPGALRDTLVAAILEGEKTSTSSTLIEYEIEKEPLPVVGQRYALVDSDNKRVAVLEVSDVQQVRLVDVPWEHARDEGEGYKSVAQWRAGHEAYWHGDAMRSFLGDPTFTVTDETIVVLERFVVVSRVAAA